MWQTIKTLVLVTVVTCLVWLYAEGENVKPRAIDADVRLVAPAGQPLLVTPGEPRRVRVMMRCSNTKFAEVERWIRAGPISVTVHPEAGAGTAEGRQVIDLRERLASASAL